MKTSNLSKSLVNLAYFVLGLFGAVAFLFLLIVSIPVIIYRWILYKIAAPLWRPDIVEIVNMKSQGFATDFLPKYQDSMSRCSIVTTSIAEGTIEKEEMLQVLKKRWIEAKAGRNGEFRKFPEFQQYIEQWMGYMFWVKDKLFDLENHLHVYRLDKDVTPEEAKAYVDKLRESILGKPYVPKRSPWDFHVVLNYKDPELQDLTKEEFMTATLFRCHHSMADGASILSLLVEGVCEASLSTCKIAHPPVPKTSVGERALILLKIPFQIVKDMGYTMTLFLIGRTPFSMNDEAKEPYMFYKKSPLIPIRKIKEIKNRLGSSFMGVIMSSKAAGIAHTFKKKGYKGSLENFPFGITLPLPGHPDRMDNHMTGAILELPITSSLDPLERLRRTEESMNCAKKSCIPLLMPIFQKLIFLQPAPITRHLFHNRFLHTGSSDFPGPQQEMRMNGRKVLSCHFISGQLVGIAGVSFANLSFGEHLQIATCVQPSVLSREEVEDLMGSICKEIDELHDRALASRLIN